MKKANLMTAVILCLTFLVGCIGNGGAGMGSQVSIGGISTGEHKVIATVNGEDVYEDIYMAWYLRTVAMNANLDMSADLDEQMASRLQEYKYDESYLGGYTDQILFLQEAEKNGIAIEDQEVDSFLAQISMMYENEGMSFSPVQAMWGFSDDAFREYIREQLILQRLYEETTGSVTEPEMTPEEYYNANPMEFKMGETRLVRHILVESLEEAEAIIGSLNEGEEFGKLVSEKSMDTGSAANGGVIGPFDSTGAMADGGSLVTPFTEASFALEKIGDFTQTPAESQFGYHIIILDGITPARTVAFEEVRDNLANQLLQEAKDAQFYVFFEEIKSIAVITYADGIPTNQSGMGY